MSSADSFLKKIYALSLHKRLLSGEVLLAACNSVQEVLLNESPEYRPRVPDTEIPGGLLDFSEGGQLPVIVVPDIHARPDFIFNILNFTLTKRRWGLSCDMRVLDALEREMIRLVLVGDLLHGEARVYERWLRALKSYMNGDAESSFMKAEMREGLSALLSVMECKMRWPKNFHCLKGNHENIKNEDGSGNYPFRKFALEGRMVRDFMLARYGERVINGVYSFEKSLPLAFCTKNIFVSHGEPVRFFRRDELVSAPFNPGVVYGLTWTRNDEAQPGSVSEMLGEYCRPDIDGVEARYIGGHRPVKGKFFTRQGGLYIQIHNPNEQNIALVRPDRTFIPEKDIIGVEK